MARRAKGTAAGIALVMALALAGCSTASRPDTGVPDATPGTSAPDGGSAGLRLAPGLYDQGDGTVLALGRLEWRDLEGGFWAVIDTTGAHGDIGDVVAVIPDVAKDDKTFAALAGKPVEARGRRLDGASIRNAGPEIQVTGIAEVTDQPGIAE